MTFGRVERRMNEEQEADEVAVDLADRNPAASLLVSGVPVQVTRTNSMIFRPRIHLDRPPEN